MAGMEMRMDFLGGSGGKPWQGQVQQQVMKLSPRLRDQPLTEVQRTRLFTFTGQTIPQHEEKSDEHDHHS